MSSSRYLLDTSALLAWIGGEPGAERVGELLRSDNEIVMPWPVRMELFYVSVRAIGEARALQRYATVKQLPVTHLDDVDESLILTAGRLKALHPMSMVDALIAAYAMQAEAVLLHKDPEYEALQGRVPMEVLPYREG